MSLRSASRLLRSARPSLPLLTRSPVLVRRAASGHAAGSGGSDMQWALGSAVVFIPLAAWILMPSTHGPEHTPHDTGITAAEDQHGRRGIETIHADVPGEEGDEAPNNNAGVKESSGTAYDDLGMEEEDGMDGKSRKDIKASLNRAEKSNVPRVAMDEEAKGNDTQHEKDVKEGGSDEGTKSDDDEGDVPSDADIMNSLHQAENAAVPRAAMEDEKKHSK